MVKSRPVRAVLTIFAGLFMIAAVAACEYEASQPTKNIWLSQAEILRLPTSGAAYDAVVSAANSSWGTARLDDNNSQHDVKTLAGALVAVRNDDAAMRDKTRAAIMDATQSPTYRALEASRGVQAYVIAADIVGLNATDTETFRAWLNALIHEELEGGHSGGQSIVEVAELSPSNWGCHARASATAAALYLGDTALFDRMVTAQRAWIGQTGYVGQFKYTSTDWHPDNHPPRGIAHPGAVENHNGAQYDTAGVMAEDQRRAGEPTFPPPGENYAYEAMQGCMATQIMQDRALGGWTQEWSKAPFERAIWFLWVKASYPYEGDDQFIGPMFDFYANPFPEQSTSSNWTGKGLGWTHWTHLNQDFSAYGPA